MPDEPISTERSVFGMPMERAAGLDTDEPDPLTADLTEEEVAAPESEAPAEPAEEEPEAERVPTAADEGEPVEEEEAETPEEEAQRLLAGRYGSLEDLERGYTELQRLQTRTAEAHRAEQIGRQQERAEVQQLLQQLAPLLQGQQQPQPPQVPGPGHPSWDPDNPEMVQAYMDSQWSAREQTLRTQFDQQLQQAMAPVYQQQRTMTEQAARVQQEQELATYTSEIDAFRSEHPEVTVGSVQEAAVANVLAPLGPIAVMPSRPMLQMALDATRSPRLLGEIEAERVRVEGISQAMPGVPPSQIPSLFDSQQGVETLYHRAGLAPPGTQAQNGARRSPEQQQAARRAAHVETGGSGAPVTSAPGQLPQDEFDEAMATQATERARSPFFGGGGVR